MTAVTSAPLVIDWGEVRSMLDEINVVAVADLDRAWQQARWMDRAAAHDYMQQALLMVMEMYGQVSAEASAQWFDSLLIDDAVQAVPVTGITAGAVEAKSRWGTAQIWSGDDPTTRMFGLAQQAVWGSQRKTVEYNASSMGVGWARYARPDSCSFCRFMAARGGAYMSHEKALFRHSTGSGMAEKYHDHCRCTAVPILEHVDTNLPSQIDYFREQVAAAQREVLKDDPSAVVDLASTTAAMRKLGYGA